MDPVDRLWTLSASVDRLWTLSVSVDELGVSPMSNPTVVFVQR